MIIQNKNRFVLHTAHTTYAFFVTDTGHLEHVYYGKRIRLGEDLTGFSCLTEKHAFAPGNSVNYDGAHPSFTQEDVCYEISSYGKGDIRDVFVSIIGADGNRTSDFLYKDFSAYKGKKKTETLPGSYGTEDDVETLCVTLTDKVRGITMELCYHVYETCDVITRTAKLINTSACAVTVDRLMSAQVDFCDSEYVLTTFHGAWAREMNTVRRNVLAGRYVGGSMTGTSSSRTNPFFMLSKPDASEKHGACYGFNLIYSGNHYESAEVNAYGKTRVLFGISPESFSYRLEPGECFEAPEAVLAYSSDGLNALSHIMHGFVREHIVRGAWKKRLRPILLNSWEASYFDINEKKLLKLAKEAADVGIELFVMDDGWFGERDDDTKSLGDWTVNTKKLPNGLGGLCEKIKQLGLDFGIWVEPEMVNTDSRLYRAHPDWCIAVPGTEHSEGRNQRILDLTRRDVQDYVIQSMRAVFSAAEISYVKWDMNRIFSDYYSPSLPADRQGEVAHRYVLGLYRILTVLMSEFPDILFEGCASGGNRFDLGMLCFFPQIWGSDNTDAISRAAIQTGYSYGYPPETVGCHVSGCPNHQTLRNTPLETRFAVACFGSLGYECNLCDMKKEELAAVKEQIALYKSLRPFMQFGTFYRGRTFASSDGNLCEWTTVSADGKHAVGMLLQKLVVPNSQYACYTADGLSEDVRYRFSNRSMRYNIKGFGDLINTVAPIHVRQDSVLHNVIARFKKMDGETEAHTAYGDLLMNAGVKLTPGFGGTGYNENVRYFQDFAARLYFMEEEK